MEGELLRREEEFHKINSELEQRTHRLLREMEAARTRVAAAGAKGFEEVSIGEHPRSFCLRGETNCASDKTRAGKSKASGPRALTQRSSSGDDDPLAAISNGMSFEATNRLLRAKLTILNKEVDTLRQDYKTKAEECRRVSADLARTEEERGRLESSLIAAKDSAAALQIKLESANHSVTRLQGENSALTKELASVKKEAKQQKHQASTVELRLNRALEEADKLRVAAKQTQQQHKEEREHQRHNIDRLQGTIKSLERQRMEIMSVCTKQLHLLDNLRRQKAHLEATRYLHTAETEFENVLDWCLRDHQQPSK